MSIYAVGGFSQASSLSGSGGPLDHVERYDLIHNQWEYLEPMKNGRLMHSSCLINMYFPFFLTNVTNSEKKT